MSARENAPAGNRGASQKDDHCKDTSPGYSAVSADPRLPAVPVYMVIVEIRGEKFLRRPYMSLQSAERAVERARLQGRYATMRLVRCVPEAGGLE